MNVMMFLIFINSMLRCRKLGKRLTIESRPLGKSVGYVRITSILTILREAELTLMLKY